LSYKMDRKLLCLVTAALFTAAPVSAYIDPGTGGMIIGGSIWPIVAAMLAAAGGFILSLFKPVRDWISRLWGRLRGRV